MTHPRLVAFDLDDTLAPSKGRIDDRIADLLAELLAGLPGGERDETHVAARFVGVSTGTLRL